MDKSPSRIKEKRGMKKQLKTMAVILGLVVFSGC
jgi:hypothetical protein